MSLTPDTQRELLARLHTLAFERETAEGQTRSEFETASDRAKQTLSDSRQGAIMRFQLDRDNTQREYDAVIAGANMQFETLKSGADSELRHTTEKLQTDCVKLERRAKKKASEETWEANTVFEATQNAPKIALDQEEKQIEAVMAALDQGLAHANRQLVNFRHSKLQRPKPEAPAGEPPAIDGAMQKLNDTVPQVREQLQALARPLAARMLVGGTPFGMFLLLAGVFCGLGYLIFGTNNWTSWTWLIVGGVATLIAAIAGGIFLYRKATAAITPLYENFYATLVAAQDLKRAALAHAKEKCAAESKRIVEHRDNELRSSKEKYESTKAALTSQRDAALQAAQQKYKDRLAELTRDRDTAIADAHATYPPKLETIRERYQTTLHAAQDTFNSTTESIRREHDEAWNSLSTGWRNSMQQVRQVVEEHHRESDKYFPAWNNPQWNTWQPPTAPPPALQFGAYQVDLSTIPAGISGDDRLNGILPTKFAMPAWLPFPRNSSLLIKAAGEGRRHAIAAVQALMLRMLTTIPPSKVRFTIIDPVGLGENFAGFMHLADYDEQLVTNRIWTEPQQIEQRLADLTEQMENVIQKYLRNEFKSIDEYNAFAGEVAEPFRVLVVANFPVNFTENAARRLTSIATTGARCGVYTLVINDVNQPLPPRFDMKDLEKNAVTLAWSGQRFVWQDQGLQNYPLALDKPPSEEQFTRLVHVVGRGAKEAKRVEVPFDYVAPQRDKWWEGDTGKNFRVPLGRAGATKLQYMNLGQGTSQHVLIAGKTGSGKSTLLHALVTNAALMYSPDQLELYLIDFKKGVEFKTYATHSLPHARVIAIESEREFGLSVLEKLDVELRRRGDLFRDAGVQDLNGYRAAVGARSMPRLLLVVDEFQELFTDDDKLAQDAALLLDRLVRQGRAFGMHVLLGSQTLGGAYSLARSTIGQMAVRVALQCSEADANLILSEENSAARLLSRPGEAIYNDANGLVAGNHPFQVVWLSDERREEYLIELRELADKEVAADRINVPTPPIVFEGNIPSDLTRNRALSEMLRAADWPVQSTPIHAWLGDAIAIKDPTAAVLRPQSGSNLLVVGQREESVLGMLAASFVSLAAQHRPTTTGASGTATFAAGSPAKFYILEHDRPTDVPLGEPLADFRSGLSAFSTILPHEIHAGGRRDLPAIVAEVAKQVDERQTKEQQTDPAIYLFINDLGRFRDLRRDDNDMGFSFGGEDKPPSPAKMLATILRDGPAVGVYTIVWCDSLNSVNRSFDRQLLREFGLRILFQMSANDSSHLIDSPLASRLGPHVAFFHNEEEGRLEKFRPYAWPTLDWLAAVQERFTQRSTSEK
jgi:DNA segregation ATPase FtsK/SpoIIIE, S-DNA-T family